MAIMTQRLYWQDPYRRSFSSNVVASLIWEDKPAVVLDQTCFYATSGGQPHDTGTLNGIPVLDVLEDQGRIIHVLARALEADSAQGDIDWARRFDHMQQHTGQHILSQAFDRLLDAETVSFHLGDESCTIDLGISELGDDDVDRVEELSNQIIAENRAISTCEVSESQIEQMPLRKQPQVQGSIRLVDIADFDLCACGGTHVGSTGEIGSIHVRRWERRRDVVRVEFLCGWRALRDYRKRDRITQELARRQSVAVDDLPEALTRLEGAEAESRHQAESLRRRLLDCELPRLVAQMDTVGGWRVLSRLLDGYDAGNMRYMAQQMVSEPGCIVLLAVSDPSPQLCFARSEDVVLDMGELLRQTVSSFGGRGGGRPHLAQGGGVAADDLSRVLDQARKTLEPR